jgi:soluble lytic murein transglycosylase
MFKKPRNFLTCCSLGILFICLLSTGGACQPSAFNLPFLSSNSELTAAAFEELINKLSELPASDRRQQLKDFADHAKETTIRQKAAYVLARDLQSDGQPADLKEAMSRYQQALSLKPLSNLCLWHAYESALKLADEHLIRDTLLAIVNSQKERAAEAQYALGQSCMRTGEKDDARRWFTAVEKDAPASQFALGSSYYLAELDLADVRGTGGDVIADQKTHDGGGITASQPDAHPPQPDETQTKIIAQAIASLRHYLQVSPDGRFAATIADQLRDMKDQILSVNDHNLFAQAYYLCGNYSQALAEWKKAGNTRDWFKQSLALLRLGRANEGKALLNKGMVEHPSDGAVPAAAAVLCHMLNHNDSVAVWTGVLHRSPKFADVAMYNLGLRAPTPAASLSYYQKIISQYPSSSYAPESAWWVGWFAAKQGKSRDALAVWKSAAARYPDARAAERMLYWQGKLDERLGDKASAKAAYLAVKSKVPWHYYAHRAAARLAALAGGKDSGWATNPDRRLSWTGSTAGDWQFPQPPPYLVPHAGTTLALLSELHQWDECLSQTGDKSDAMKAFFLAKLNMPHQAINTASKALHGPPKPTELWQLAFPLLYARTISSESSAKNVDPLLVQALVREESRYDHEALSSSHALGLMQLLPATAYGVARRLGMPVSHEADFYDPDKNLRLGIDYLSYTLKRFNGNALFAVASYNGGPNAVQRWSAKGVPDADVFVENIPFTETRDYVRKVFSSYWNYEQVYQPPAVAKPQSPANQTGCRPTSPFPGKS